MRRGRTGTMLTLLALAGGVLLLACASEDGATGSPTSGGPFPGSGGTAGSPFEPQPPGADPDVDGPEEEIEESFRAPVVSGQYLWTSNPETHRVARINGSTLDIEIFEGGFGPTYLAALPSGPTKGGALVLNELSDDASIFLQDEDGAITVQERISVQQGASAWSVGKSGKYAVAWSNYKESSLADIDGHQDLTIFDFTGEDISATTLSVGFRPSEVLIDEAESHVFVVSEPGISVIELGDDIAVKREIFLPEGNLVGDRDIEFTPDGALALSRTQGSAEILLIDTATAETKTMTLSGPVTDLDLSRNGTLGIAVVRGGQSGNQGLGGASNPDDSVIALIDPSGVFADPDGYTTLTTSEVVGSVVIAEDGSQALLFTNANDSNTLSILNAKEETLRVVDLKAPARAAFLASDGSFAVALMAPPPGSTKSGAFALVPVAEELPPRIEGTNNIPEFVTLSADESRALVTTKATASRGAQTFFARFPGLRVDRIELPSRPLASGIVPDAGQAFVAQEHPEGRVTFVETETGIETTVTGFELAAKVVE